MNENEITAVIALLTSAWTNWSDETVTLWWNELRSLHAAGEDCRGAALLLVDTLKFKPSWAEFRAEAMRLRREREQRASEAKALAEGQTERGVQRDVNRAGATLVASTYRRLGMARGTTVDVYAHRHANGAADGCRFCKRHDHSDRRTIGFSQVVLWREGKEGRERIALDEPIPMWHLSCPRCGVTEHHDSVCDTWTPLGVQQIKLLTKEKS